jgi:hypothetical protein
MLILIALLRFIVDTDLLYGQHGFGDLAVEEASVYLVCFHFFSFICCNADILTGVDKLADMDLMVFLGDESNGVGPGLHFQRRGKHRVRKVKYLSLSCG